MLHREGIRQLHQDRGSPGWSFLACMYIAPYPRDARLSDRGTIRVSECLAREPGSPFVGYDCAQLRLDISLTIVSVHASASLGHLPHD